MFKNPSFLFDIICTVVWVILMVRYARCLLYTSDAADEEDSVDIGGGRLIKKKKTEYTRDV